MRTLGCLWQDTRYALRGLRRNPVFTMVAVLSLALGIGANTAVFSLINTLMLRVLPVPEPQQLVELLQVYPGEPRGNGFWSWPSYEYYRDHNHVFSGLLAASTTSRFAVRGDGLKTETVNGQSVSGNFFQALAVKPATGRLIGPEDESAAPVAVVSWSYWKSRFNLDPAILGKRIFVQDAPATVIGVAPREFFGLQVGSRTDIWLPLAPSPSTRLALVGRMRRGASIEQARAEMTVLYKFTIEERASASKDPLIRKLKIEVEPAGTGLSILRDHFAKPLLALMAVMSLVLLIACTNIAGLLLARGASRQREMAIRVSLGAGRLRLMSQVLTESVLLSAVGGLLGLFLATFGANALVRILASGRPMIGLEQPLEIAVRPDAHVLLLTAAVALLTGILFGLVPAWNAFTFAPASSLRAMRSGETKFGRLFGKTLVAAQVGVSVMLLSAAGLFVRHLSNLQHVDLGFRRDHVLLVTLDRAQSTYSSEALSSAYRELLAKLETIPGVRSVTISAPTPLSGAGASALAKAEGYQERPEERRYIALSWIAPRYFETLGIPFLVGRDFNLQDQGVAIINQAMLRRYFPNGNPIGKRVTLEQITGTAGDKSYRIVGVVGDAKYSDLAEAAPRAIYLPAFQNGSVLARNFVLRTNIEPESVAGDVGRAVSDVLKTIAVAQIATMSDQIDASIVPERLIATLSASFGALGSLLAAIGLYGLLAYTVARRIREIGVRMALGATTHSVSQMVLLEALVMVCGGLAVGVPVAYLGKSIAASLMEGLSAESAIPIAFGAAAMVALGLVAAYVPARRAARVDPIEALRHD